MTKPKNMSIEEWRLRCNARHATRREHVGKINRRRRVNKPAAVMYSEAKKRAKRDGVPFNIEISDIEIPLICPLLNMWLSTGSKIHSPHSPSLDRIDNDLGYVKGNVWVISDMANRMKRNASRTQLLNFARGIIEKFTAT